MANHWDPDARRPIPSLIHLGTADYEPRNIDDLTPYERRLFASEEGDRRLEKTFVRGLGVLSAAEVLGQQQTGVLYVTNHRAASGDSI